jgi:hypothetical protein
MRQIPVGRLKQVQTTTADGQTLRGRYHGWVAGRAGIEIGSELLWLENDRVVARTPLAPPALAQVGPPAGAGPAVASVVAPMPAMPVPEPAAGPDTVALPPPGLPAVRVMTTPGAVTEATGAIVFTVELSRPIDDLLVVIYSTVDGAARAGADYQAAQGILTLPAGATREQFRTVVIDDEEAEGDEAFQLFVATNPELTEVAQQWLQVTIHDDD